MTATKHAQVHDDIKTTKEKKGVKHSLPDFFSENKRG